MNLSWGKASLNQDMAARQEFATICTATVSFCWIQHGIDAKDDKTFVKPLELDPDFRETRAMVLDAVRVLFDRSVVTFFPPEHGGEVNASMWLTINGFKESMSDRWASSQ